MKRFLEFLPRLILEMLAGVIVLFAMATVGSVIFAGIEFFSSRDWAMAAAWPFQMFFLVFNYPLLWILDLVFRLFTDGRNYEAFGFTYLLPCLVVYNCILFALFCEIVRFWRKRKTGDVEDPPKPER